jgi:hypothetical protein
VTSVFSSFVIPSGVEESLDISAQSAVGNSKRCLDVARHDRIGRGAALRRPRTAQRAVPTKLISVETADRNRRRVIPSKARNLTVKANVTHVGLRDQSSCVRSFACAQDDPFVCLISFSRKWASNSPRLCARQQARQATARRTRRTRGKSRRQTGQR